MIDIPTYDHFDLNKIYFVEVNTEHIGFFIPRMEGSLFSTEWDARHVVESLVPSDENIWWKKFVDLKQVTLENGLPNLSRITKSSKEIADELLKLFPNLDLRSFSNTEEYYKCKFPIIFDAVGTLYGFEKKQAPNVRDGDITPIFTISRYTVRSYKFMLEPIYYSRYWETVNNYINNKASLSSLHSRLINSIGGQK